MLRNQGVVDAPPAIRPKHVRFRTKGNKHGEAYGGAGHRALMQVEAGQKIKDVVHESVFSKDDQPAQAGLLMVRTRSSY